MSSVTSDNLVVHIYCSQIVKFNKPVVHFQAVMSSVTKIVGLVHLTKVSSVKCNNIVVHITKFNVKCNTRGEEYPKLGAFIFRFCMIVGSRSYLFGHIFLYSL